MDKNKKYFRTEKGFFSFILMTHRKRNREGGFPPPDYDLQYLRETFMDDPLYKERFNTWKGNGFRGTSPSIIRIDNKLPYKKGNLILTSGAGNHNPGDIKLRDKQTRAARYIRNREKINKQRALYKRTRYGVLATLYKTHRNKSLKKGWELPDYTQEQLVDKFINDHKFLICFCEWQESGYKKELKPSIDRINPTLPYKIDNIQMMSWKENADKAHKFDISIHIILCNPITKEEIAYFNSLAEASRIIKVDTSSLSRINKEGYCRGYYWKKVDRTDSHIRVKAIGKRDDRRVALFNTRGEIIRTFNSVNEASRLQGTDKYIIHSSCNNKRSCRANKPYWMYITV